MGRRHIAERNFPDFFCPHVLLLFLFWLFRQRSFCASQMWGMGDAMRRRSIVSIGRVLADKDPETTSLLDVGCGTGRFLTFVKARYFMHMRERPILDCRCTCKSATIIVGVNDLRV